MIKNIFLILVLFVTSCGVKQPIEPSNNSITQGSIFINSTPTGAAIILDNKAIGKFTPDSLYGISAGMHTVHVYKEGFKSIPDSININVNTDSIPNVHFQLHVLTTTGVVFVESFPGGAWINVDGKNTNQQTPDTLVLEIGSHLITLQKNGFQEQRFETIVIGDSLIEVLQELNIRQMVLLESFANVSCLPCVDASENLEIFTQKTDETFYAIIEYFADWPNPNDPFYAQAPIDVDKRIAFYDVTGLPALYMGGSKQVDATIAGEIDKEFALLIGQQESNLAISLDHQLHNDSLQIDLTIYDFENIINTDNLRLFAALIENDIQFDQPPGSNGLTHFNWVLRGFVSANEGETLQFDDGLLDQFMFKVKWNQGWQYENCVLITFIQDIETRRIEQVGYK
jgi:hypothetical protein